MALTHNYLETAGFKPTAAEAEKAELVINLSDGTLWSENGAGTVIQVGGSSDGLVTGDIGVTVQAYSAVLTSTTAVFLLADETKLDGIEALAEVNNISDVNATDLTDAGDSILHYHATDRSRANHTGTQTLATISDSGTAAAVNTGTTTGTVPLLDGNNQIPATMMPPLAITTTYVVASEVLQLALTVQEGDVAVRSDESKSYIALNDTNATMADWQELLTPTGSGTNLALGTRTTTTMQVTSSTGTDVDLVLATTTQAGLISDVQFDILGATSGSNTGDNSTNTLYSGLVSNVDTELSNGTINATTYGITSDGSVNDVILASATGTLSGVMPAADKVKTDHITVTQAVNLDTIESNQVGSLLTGESA